MCDSYLYWASFFWQHNFLLSGGVPLCLKMITSDSFLPTADLTTRRYQLYFTSDDWTICFFFGHKYINSIRTHYLLLIGKSKFEILYLLKLNKKLIHMSCLYLMWSHCNGSFCCCYPCVFSRSAYLTVLRISKLALTAVCSARITLVAEAVSQQGETCLSQVHHNHVVLLQKATQSIPNPSTECVTRSTANKLGSTLYNQVKHRLLFADPAISSTALDRPIKFYI